MPDIGATLREARMRARIDISEIEAETKIRAKYLRALENEEWDLLPGPTYVKSFLRTYADALGLDGKLLIEEYKLRHERLSDVELQPIAPPGQRERRRRAARRRPARLAGGRRRRRAARRAVAGGQPQRRRQRRAGQHAAAGVEPADDDRRRQQGVVARRTPKKKAKAKPKVARLTIVATGQVYVCLKAAGKRTLGARHRPRPAAPARARTSPRASACSWATSEARLIVNGKSRSVPPVANGIGYEITPRKVRRLPSAAVAALPDRVSARAGIVVTGTEVLTGRVTDRNGPWLSERLRELGVDHALHADRRRPPRGHASEALRFLAARGRRPDRHQRRAGADRRRPDRRGRGRVRRGARWSSTRRSRSASPRSCAR